VIRCLPVFFMSALLLLPHLAQAADNFQPLFNGKNLDGWRLCNGYAKYRVENGAIIGTTAEGSPNSFLCTTRDYGDFVLEFETKTDPTLNSGVQIRSRMYPSDGVHYTFDEEKRALRTVRHVGQRVYGYQVEISNAQQGTSGGIYDEARRGWLQNVSSDVACARAFKDSEWNHYRIEAEGDRIRTWVNRVPCAELVDPMDQTGFIALQVHSYKGSEPAEVSWRNLRIEDRGRHVWKRLWDGKTFNGWSTRGGAQWTLLSDSIHAKSIEGNTQVGFMVTDQTFGDITTRVKFRIPKGNSGFFVRVDERMRGYEVEIDATKRTGGFWDTAGRAWVTGPEDNAAVFPDEWSEVSASLHGHRVVFHLNGFKTVELPNDEVGRLEGHIALQCHGAKMPTEVFFKDVEILVKAAPGK
jgi:hypothetical protein